MVPRDPVHFPIDPSEGYQDLGTRGAASELVKLARSAFQEKQLRNCLTLTAAILKMDPDNKDARLIQSWVFADLEQEFEMAQKLAEGARHNGTWAGVQMAVRRILNVLPEHEGAKALLAEALAAPPIPESPPEDDFPRPSNSPSFALPFEPVFIERKRTNWIKPVGSVVIVLILTALIYYGAPRLRQTLGALGISRAATASPPGQLEVDIDDGLQVFVDGENKGTAPLAPITLPSGKHELTYKSSGLLIAQEDVDVPANGTASNTLSKLVGRVDLLLVPATGVDLAVDGTKVGAAPAFILLKPGAHQLQFTAEGRSPEVRNVNVNTGERTLVPVLLHELGVTDAVPADPPGRPANSKAGNAPAADNGPAPDSPPPPPARTAAARGKLSVTSSIRAQIFLDGRLLGTTPATLDLPAGDQTLEYRADGLSKKVTSQVRAGQTTTVSVVMDTVVQINAQPWAEVFIQDGRNTSLGQTPLSGVRVPVGSTLIFKNPQFPDKTYRVKSTDTTIAVMFP